MARREVVMPVAPRRTVSEAENFCVKGGIAAERPQPKEWDAMKAPAATREERWRKSRRSIKTSGGWQQQAYTNGTDGCRQCERGPVQVGRLFLFFEFAHLHREIALVAEFRNLVHLGFEPVHVVFFVLEEHHQQIA